MIILLFKSRETYIEYNFDNVKVEAGKHVNIRFVIDRSIAEAHTASVYIDGILAQTIEAGTISSVTKSPLPFVFGGNRVVAEKTFIDNPDYFKGVITDLSVWKGIVYPGDTASPDLNYNYSEKGNTSKVIKDQSGNGYDAIYTVRYISADQVPERIEDYAYSFAVVGDPQFVAQNNPSAFMPMYQWIIDQNPEYVIGLGDLQNINDTSDKSRKQWQVVQEAIYSLDDAGIPHTHVRGNHDHATLFNEYLPWSRYGEIYDGVTAGAYDDNLLNTWRTIEIGDTKWLIIGLDYIPETSELDWAAGVIENHPEHNVIIATHFYISHDGAVPSSQPKLQNIWNKLANKYENVVMVLCGHKHSDNVIVTQRENSVGTTVTEMLIDFQYVDFAFDETAAIATMFHFSED